jgi:hypothetical protein
MLSTVETVVGIAVTLVLGGAFPFVLQFALNKFKSKGQSIVVEDEDFSPKKADLHSIRSVNDENKEIPIEVKEYYLKVVKNESKTNK